MGVTNIQQDCAAQRAGCDVVLTLSNGQTVKVDEKLQRRETNTLYLEYEVGKGKAGWMEKDLAVDYIAYGMLPSRTAYMLPYPQLRGAWAKYGEEWKQLYTKQTLGSKGACPPASHVLAAIAEALEVVA